MDTPQMLPAVPQNAPPRPANPVERWLGESQIGLDLIEIRNILRRRKSIIFASIAVVTAMAVAYVNQVTPLYTAGASLMVDVPELQITDIKDVSPGLGLGDEDVVRSEVEVLKSAPIATRVVKTLGLTQNPEFNARLAPPTAYQQLVGYVRGLIGLNAAAADTGQPAAPVPDPAADEIRATKTLMGHISVTNDGRSYIIQVHATSVDPRTAAAVANAYVDAYLLEELDSKFEAVRRANDWLSDHLNQLKQKVEASDQAVQAFKAAHDIVTTGGNGSTITAQQVTELSTQLILAKADLAQKESNLSAVEAEMRNGGTTGASQVLDTPLIQELRKQESDLLVQEAQLATRYKPAHPAMINIRAQEADLKDKINAEIEKTVHGMQGDVEAARARVDAMTASLNDLQKSMGVQDQASVQLAELQREADADRTLYQNFLNRFGQTSSESDMQMPDARVVDTAFVPTTPSYPRKTMTVTLAFAVSIVFGILMALGVEHLDHGFRTADQAEHLIKVPILGLVPETAGYDMAPQDAVVQKPISSYAEAIRTTRTSLRYSDIDHPPKVVLVTSALPDEGKSVFSLSLARSVARSGRKALMFDCDLRRPSLKRLLKKDDDPGVLSAFQEGGSILDVIRVEEETGMHYVLSNSGTPNPQDLLGSNMMRKMLDELRERYDRVVLDTPPLLAVSDALVLSHLADTSIFLIRWGRTPRPVAAGALKQLQVNGGPLAGAVLSRVNFKRHAYYYYGDSGYYYGYYGRRYGDRYGSYGEKD